MSSDNPTLAQIGEANIRACYGIIPDIRKKPLIPKPPTQRPQEKMIVLRCPVCKIRTEIPVAQWEVGIPCGLNGCEGKMTYHKDKVINRV